MFRDIGYALRSFRRNPGFTAVVVVSIAIGIAANTAVFSVVNGLLLGSLPAVEEPDRLVAFANGNTQSYLDYGDYRDQGGAVFEGVTAHFPLVPASFAGRGEPERVFGQLVAGSYFAVVRPQLALGRGVLPEEDYPGRDSVVVLGYQLWKRRFAGDPAILGRAVVLNGMPFTVVGVTRDKFAGADRGLNTEFWAPLSAADRLIPDLMKHKLRESRNASWLVLHARLKPGVTREQAQAAVAVVKRRIDDEHFPKDTRRRARAMTLHKAGVLLDGGSTPITSLMRVMMVVAGLVLLIACANVANLLLARGAARQREIAIRLSVGAGRGRLVRQLLTENMLLAMMGAAAGLTLAWWAAAAMQNLRLPLAIPLAFHFTPDARVLAFTAALTVVTGLFFGLAPALRASRPDLTTALKNQTAVSGRARRFGMRGALVVVQMALAMVLLAGSGLFLRSLRNAASIDIGMKPVNVLLMAVDPKLHRYPAERTRDFVAQLRARVSALPGVRKVTFVDSLPLSIGGTSFDFTAESADEAAQRANADVYQVGAGFFDVMGLPLKRGRDFSLASGDQQAAIINETLAERLFGARDPLGRRMTANKGSYTVVGIAANAKSRTLGEAQRGCAYLFLEPAPDKVMSFYGISVATKTDGNPRRLERAIRSEIAALDPHLATFNVETMEEHVRKAFLLPRLSATLLTIFGAAGLSLAAVGLYGVMSYAVRRRTREFGIRMALGAEAGGVLRMVLRQGLGLAAAGLGIGLALALAGGRFAASLLYGVESTDLFTFLAVPAVLFAVAAVAVIVPARRAARVAVVAALRCE